MVWLTKTWKERELRPFCFLRQSCAALRNTEDTHHLLYPITGREHADLAGEVRACIFMRNGVIG